MTYLDDILIAGSTEEKHLEALDEVLTHLGNAGLQVKYKKCEFMRTSVTYLGHKIDGAGLHPLQNKVQAIKDAPTPQSVPELKLYLGMLTYYGKFLPNLSSTLLPLYNLLKKDVLWRWGHEYQRAFQSSKDILTSDKFLAHFDPGLPLTLACDASGYGLGAVLAHNLPDGSEKPIGYASRTLTAAEQNVFAKNYGSGNRWLSGKVTGPVSFRVKLDDCRVRRYHQDQFKHQVVDDHTAEMSNVGADDSIPIAIPVTTENTTSNNSHGTTIPPGPLASAELPSSVGLSQEQLKS